MSSALCRPAAVTSRARRPVSWPCSSARSGSSASASSSWAAPMSASERERPLAAQVVDHGRQARRSERLQIGTEGGLSQIGQGNDGRRDGPQIPRRQHRECSLDRSQRPIQAEFSQIERRSQALRGELDLRGRDPDGQGQVERGARLGDSGRGEVDRDSTVLELEARLAERGSDPIAALVHDAIRLSYDVEGRQARSRVDLDGYANALDPVQARAVHADQQFRRPPEGPMWGERGRGGVPSPARVRLAG